MKINRRRSTNSTEYQIAVQRATQSAIWAMPAADAFWSITLYDEQGFMIPSMLRNQIGTYNDLHEDPDGSVPITIQHECPNEDIESNWLPAPQSGFTLTMRLYNPRTPVLTPDWEPPIAEWVK